MEYPLEWHEFVVAVRSAAEEKLKYAAIKLFVNTVLSGSKNINTDGLIRTVKVSAVGDMWLTLDKTVKSLRAHNGNFVELAKALNTAASSYNAAKKRAKEAEDALYSSVKVPNPVGGYCKKGSRRGGKRKGASNARR